MKDLEKIAKGAVIILIGLAAILSNKRLRNKKGFLFLLCITALVLFLIIAPFVFINPFPFTHLKPGLSKWGWYEKWQCEIDPCAKCSFSVKNNSISLHITPAGNLTNGKWMDSVYIAKDVNYFLGNKTMLSWAQGESYYSAHVELVLFTSQGYRKLTYSAFAPNHWETQGWVNMSNENSSLSSSHDRNVMEDYFNEYNDSVPYSIEQVRIGHFYDREATEDIGVTIYNLSIKNLPLPLPANKGYLLSKLKFNLLKERYRFTKDDEARVDLQRKSLNMSKGSLIGIGLGRYRTVYNARFGQDVYHAHNIFLQILVEMGIFALVVFIWILFLLFKTSIVSKTKNIYLGYVKTGLLLGVIAVLIHGLVDYPFYSQELALLFWFIIAVIMVINND